MNANNDDVPRWGNDFILWEGARLTAGEQCVTRAKCVDPGRSGKMTKSQGRWSYYGNCPRSSASEVLADTVLQTGPGRAPLVRQLSCGL